MLVKEIKLVKDKTFSGRLYRPNRGSSSGCSASLTKYPASPQEKAPSWSGSGSGGKGLLGVR